MFNHATKEQAAKILRILRRVPSVTGALIVSACAALFRLARRHIIVILTTVGTGLGLLVGLGQSGVLLKERKILFIFDTGETGGPGHPGYDLHLGIDKAWALNEGFFSDRKIIHAIFSDGGNDATARKLAQEAVGDSKVIAVIGHLSSSVMAATMDTYLDSNLPVIMPVPTNPRFTDASQLSVHKNFIRLPPNDDVQAAVATDFILSKKRKRIAVIKDADNSTYSEYLARKFIANVRDAATQPNGPRVVYVSSVGGTIAEEFLPPILNNLSVDAIFFAGSTDNAITFLETLDSATSTPSASPRTSPLILMTDGVVDSKLLKKLSSVPPELYVTFPLSSNSRQSDGGACSRVFVLSFCAYGYDSVVLLKNIVDAVTPRGGDLFGKYYANVTRRSMLRFLNRDLKTEHRDLNGQYNKIYSFDNKGDNVAFRSSVWKANPEKREFEDTHFQGGLEP